MTRTIFLLLFIIITQNIFSQNAFKKGYFINNNRTNVSDSGHGTRQMQIVNAGTTKTHIYMWSIIVCFINPDEIQNMYIADKKRDT